MGLHIPLTVLQKVVRSMEASIAKEYCCFQCHPKYADSEMSFIMFSGSYSQVSGQRMALKIYYYFLLWCINFCIGLCFSFSLKTTNKTGTITLKQLSRRSHFFQGMVQEPMTVETASLIHSCT